MVSVVPTVTAGTPPSLGNHPPASKTKSKSKGAGSNMQPRVVGAV